MALRSRPLKRSVPQKNTGVVRAAVRPPTKKIIPPPRPIARQQTATPKNNVNPDPIRRTNEILGIPQLADFDKYDDTQTEEDFNDEDDDEDYDEDDY